MNDAVAGEAVRTAGADASGTPVVACRELRKTYRNGPLDVPVLLGVNLAVAQGERVAIVGASGSGKSTLLHLLGGLDVPSSGDVRVEGIPLASLSEAARGALRNRALGFIYQFHHLLPEFTALENVAMPLRIRRLDERRARDEANDMLERVGLAHRVRLVAGATLVEAADAQRHRDVLQRGEFGQQVMELVDEAERTVAQRAARGFGERGERDAFDAHLAAARHVEPAEKMKQRALPRARGADDRHALGGRDGEVDAEEHRDVEGAVAIGLAKVATRDDGMGRRLGLLGLIRRTRPRRVGLASTRSDGPFGPWLRPARVDVVIHTATPRRD
jgi:lipoprotein-releasing system ATP-binding protein